MISRKTRKHYSQFTSIEAIQIQSQLINTNSKRYKVYCYETYDLPMETPPESSNYDSVNLRSEAFFVKPVEIVSKESASNEIGKSTMKEA